MLLGEEPPDWAPKNNDIIYLEDGRFNFVIFLCDYFPENPPKQQVRIIGRLLQNLNNPEPGVGATYIDRNTFTKVGKVIYPRQEHTP